SDSAHARGIHRRRRRLGAGPGVDIFVQLLGIFVSVLRDGEAPRRVRRAASHDRARFIAAHRPAAGGVRRMGASARGHARGARAALRVRARRVAVVAAHRGTGAAVGAVLLPPYTVRVTSIQRSALVPYSDHEMYQLVADIPSYPAFLPWCGGARIVTRAPEMVVAEIGIAYKGVHKTFTTRNLLQPDK